MASCRELLGNPGGGYQAAASHEWGYARRRQSNGVVVYGQWCSCCGAWIAKKKIQVLREAGGSDLPWYAPDVAEAYWSKVNGLNQQLYFERRKRNDEKRALDLDHWRAEHDDYTRSEQWRDLRRLVFRRCGGMCEGCGVRRAEQVHHKTYDHWRAEFLFELIGLCRECHERVHGLDGASERAAGAA